MNPQPVKFNSYADFYASLTSGEQKIVTELQRLIEDCIPAARQKLSYNVPYYSLNKRICFIWPASVVWGKVKLKGVQLGFCQAHLLYDPECFLDRGERKQVYSKTYFALSEIERDHDLLKHFLLEAAEVDKKTKKL